MKQQPTGKTNPINFTFKPPEIILRLSLPQLWSTHNQSRPPETIRKIEIHHIYYGRLSKNGSQPKTTLSEYDNRFGNILVKWGTNLIHTLFKLSIGLWIIRNNPVHRQYSLSLTHEQNINLEKKLYQKRPLTVTPSNRFLF